MIQDGETAQREELTVAPTSSRESQTVARELVSGSGTPALTPGTVWAVASGSKLFRIHAMLRHEI